MRRRLHPLLVGLLLPLAGCAAGGRMPTLRPDTIGARPTPRAATPSPAAADLAARVNQNARRVQSMTASTTVSVTGKRWASGGASGQMALERPRNFKLKLERGGLGSAPVADVGSNADEFWFWTEDNDQKAIYVGHYDPSGAVPVDFLFHPDWIVEALGLRGMTQEDIARAKLGRGTEPNTLVLTERRGDGAGGSRLKQTVFDQNTLQIKRHIFYGADDKTRVAVVEPSNFRRYTLASSGESEGPPQTVDLPEKVHLELTPVAEGSKEPVQMDIALRNIKLNPTFTSVNREGLFTVPTYPGYQVVELTPRSADYARGSSRTRNDLYDDGSRRTGIDPTLEAPIPLRNEGAWIHGRDPAPLGDDLRTSSNAPVAIDRVVRPQIPQPPVRR